MSDYKEKNSKAHQKTKHSLKRKSKQQNQTWQGCWNYDREFRTMSNTLRAPMDRKQSRDMEILRKKKQKDIRDLLFICLFNVLSLDRNHGITKE